MENTMVKSAISWGNSAGVLVPREWLGKEIKIILIDRTLEIKKEALTILEHYMEDIQGIYLVGSYARNEEAEDSDIDIIAISSSLKKEIISGKYHISIVPLKNLKNTIAGDYPELILPRLLEAKPLLNKILLEELHKEVNKNSFKKFIEDTKRIIKINKKIIEMDKIKSQLLESKDVCYSIILRLRGLFLIKSILSKKAYKSKDFKKWIAHIVGEKAFEDIYQVYRSIKEKRREKAIIKISDIEKLISLLEENIKKW